MATANLKCMLEKFGVVTVMNVLCFNPVYDANKQWDPKATLFPVKDYDNSGTPRAADSLLEGSLFRLDSLKISNITSEGPNKTLTGGQTANDLLYYGKTSRMEAQEAICDIDAMEHLNGYSVQNDKVVIMTDKFPGYKTIVGETFFVGEQTGVKQPVYILIPLLLPDAIDTKSFSADGDFAVFDLNGSIREFWEDSKGVSHFYAVTTKHALDIRAKDIASYELLFTEVN